MSRISNLFDVIVGSAPSSQLATACQALASGASATFTPGLAHGMADEDLAWQTLCYHDSVNGLVQLMGKPANSPDAWSLRTYDVAGNAWASNSPSPQWSQNGHIYGALTMDYSNGDLYIHPGTLQTTDRLLRRYRPGVGWTVVTSALFVGGLNLPSNGVGWHPNLFGPGAGGVASMCEVSGTDEGLGIYRIGNGAVSSVFVGIGSALGRFYGQGVYFAAIDKMVMGGDGHILVSPGDPPTFAYVGAPPLPTKGDTSLNAGTFGVMMPHPGNAAKLLLLQRGGTRSVWETTDGDTWSAAGYTHPFTATEYALCSLRGGLGCVLSFGSGATSVLWRPPT